MNKEMNEDEIQDDFESTGEDNIVEPEIEDIENNNDVKMKKLKEKLKVCEHEKMEHLENLQRAKAEFLNVKKRLDEEKIRDKQRAENRLVEKLLPMADSFHMAMHDTEAWGAIDEQWRKGVESIHSQLHNILDSYGVKEVNPEGTAFDPALHEAMVTVPVTDKEQHDKIISVIQNGFIRKIENKEELLRPARVTIGEYSEEDKD